VEICVHIKLPKSTEIIDATHTKPSASLYVMNQLQRRPT